MNNDCYTPKHNAKKHSYLKGHGYLSTDWTWRAQFSRRNKEDDWQIHSDDKAKQAALAGEFEKLASKWKAETTGLSSILHITRNDSYLDIIGMGEKAVPLILRDMMMSPHHWFIALKAITKENPVENAHIGNVRKMTNDWIKWGKQKRLI